MSTPKRVSPYTYLRQRAIAFADKCREARDHGVMCWKYPKEKLGGNWRLDDLAERVVCAKLLGYETKLTVDSSGALVVTFHKRVDVPFSF